MPFSITKIWDNAIKNKMLYGFESKEAFIHYIYTQDTIESKILDILKTKKDITSEVIGRLVDETC